MKKVFLILAGMILAGTSLLAQDGDESEKGFKKENLFTGGSITASFFNGQTVLGANPMFGYKLADWIDAGVAFNYVYSSTRDYIRYDDKVRQTVLGPGVFTRIYPVRFLFVQAQYEKNFSTLKYFMPGASSSSDTRKVEPNSLLLGAGIVQGREPGSNTFFYLSLLFDVLKEENSPYVNVVLNPDNPAQRRIDMTPIIRAGVNIGLFQRRYR